jgi:hypothetical protein
MVTNERRRLMEYNREEKVKLYEDGMEKTKLDKRDQ